MTATYTAVSKKAPQKRQSVRDKSIGIVGRKSLALLDWGALNPLSPKSDFTLSNARRFYASKGDRSGLKGLTTKNKKAYLHLFVLFLYVAETPETINPPLPIIPFHIVAYGFVGLLETAVYNDHFPLALRWPLNVKRFDCRDCNSNMFLLSLVALNFTVLSNTLVWNSTVENFLILNNLRSFVPIQLNQLR